MLHTNLRFSLRTGSLSLGSALVVLLTAGCTQDFGAFRGGGGGSQGGQGQGGEGGSPPVCANNCNDSNPCTQDICDPDGECLHPAEEDPPLTQVLGDCKAVSCDGTEMLTETDTGDIPSDDNNPCTSEACDGDMPTHPFEPAGTACNDGVCNATGQCSDCDDAGDCGTDTQCATYACTDNACVTTFLAPLVISGENDGDCMALQCAPDEPDPQDLPYIDDEEVDANPCTTDTCSAAGDPVHDPSGLGTFCNDNLFCNGADSCDAGTTCTVHAGDPCAAGAECADTCDEATDSCNDPVGTPCGSATNNACTNPDTCNGSGVCNPNHESVGTPCPDSLFCNGVELCQAAGVCGASPGDPCLPLNQADGDCSSSCDETANNCTADDPVGTGCTDSLFCTATDACNASGTCVGTGSPCAGQNSGTSCDDSCNETTNDCTLADTTANVTCNEDGDAVLGTCTGNLTEPNCGGD